MTSAPARAAARTLPGLGALIALVLYAAGLALVWWQGQPDGALPGAALPLERLTRAPLGLLLVLFGGSIAALLGAAGAALTGATRTIWSGVALALATPALIILPLYLLGLFATLLVAGPRGEPHWRAEMFVSWAWIAVPAAIGALVATLQARDTTRSG